MDYEGCSDQKPGRHNEGADCYPIPNREFPMPRINLNPAGVPEDCLKGFHSVMRPERPKPFSGSN